MIDEQPFRPLRVHMSEGDAVVIARRDGVMVTQAMVLVALDMDERGIADRTKCLDLQHVVKVEQIGRPDEGDGQRKSD